jgi:hypothetical protein
VPDEAKEETMKILKKGTAVLWKGLPAQTMLNVYRRHWHTTIVLDPRLKLPGDNGQREVLVSELTVKEES